MRRRRKRRRGTGDEPQRPLCVLLLPGRLEQTAERERAEDLLRAPGAVAVEPAALGYGATGRMPGPLRERVAAGQARRLHLPGEPRAVVAFEAPQYLLARALLAEHPEAELWYAENSPAGRWHELHEAALARAALTFPSTGGPEPVRERNRPLWERMEALGIESGRLGSER
jgi:hypothetical protein